MTNYELSLVRMAIEHALKNAAPGIKEPKNLLPVASIYETQRRSLGGKKLWKCNACASLEPWSKDHTWYGSWRDLEDSGQVVVACSDQCRTELGGIGLVPKDAAYLERKSRL